MRLPIKDSFGHRFDATKPCVIARGERFRIVTSGGTVAKAVSVMAEEGASFSDP